MGNKNYLNNEVHLNAIYPISGSAYGVFLYYFGYTSIYPSVNIYNFKWKWYHKHRLGGIIEKCRENKFIGNVCTLGEEGHASRVCLQQPRMEVRTTMIHVHFLPQCGEQDYSDFTPEAA